MSVADELKIARAKVAKGWCKHTLEDDDGNVCLVGGLNWGTTGSAMGYPATHEARETVRRLLPDGMSLVGFNNKPETTQEDVLELLDQAIVTVDDMVLSAA